MFRNLLTGSLRFFLGAEQSGEQRHDGREPFSPSLELFRSVQVKLCVLGRLFREFFQTLQAVSSGAGHRRNAFAQNPRHKLAQAEFGLVGDSASFAAFCLIDCTKRAEELQTLAGGAFADLQTFHDVGEAQGRR